MARIGYAQVSSVGQSLEVQLDSGEKKGDYMDTLATNEWQHWLRRWDAMQMVYIPDRETRFAVMFDAIEAALPASFVALDLACGPGSLSHRLLARFPHARCVAVDLDPVLLAIGQGAVGTWGGRLRWLEGDLRGDEWADPLGDATFDAALSTTALHFVPAARGGTDEEGNLWLACRMCNGFKSDRTHGHDPLTGQDVRLFDPRRQQWVEHFAWSPDGLRVIGLTPCGRATVITLRLNNAIAVMVRREWTSAGWHPPA